MILLAFSSGRRLDFVHRSGVFFFQTLLWILCATVCGTEQYFNVEVWLQKYGYLPPTDPRMSVLRSAETMQSALAAMQQFYGINMTGKVDRNTIDWMKKPRCGVPDQTRGSSKFNIRRKRYALTGQKWQHKHITYRIKEQELISDLNLEVGAYAEAMKDGHILACSSWRPQSAFLQNS